MNSLWRWLTVLLLFAFQAGEARGAEPAPIRILVYGSDSVEQCASPVNALQAELETMRFPDGWTLGIACNPIAWTKLTRIADVRSTETAFTNLIRRSTILNAAIFRLSRHRYRHTLAHELGHATCNCGDEDGAERFALQYDQANRTAKKNTR